LENSPAPLVFEDVRRIAREERRHMMGPEPEPPELIMMREQAAADAKRIVQEALDYAEAVREEARQAGYRKGFTEGYEAGRAAAEAEAQAKAAEYRALIEAFVEQVETERQRLWRNAEPQIVAFVMEIAQKVVKEEAKINREIALSVVKNALRRVIDTERVRIRVHLADLETVRGAREELLTLIDGIDHLEIIEDRRVPPGGCVIETNAGTIDAKLETQFEELQTLFDSLQEAA
jgi:flagellar assembly protein FliH